MKVLIADSLSVECAEILKKASLEVDTKVGLSEEEICNIIADYDALIVRSATKVTKKIIEKGVNLKVIGRAGVGLDNIDQETALAKGIIVLNVPGGNTITTAEYTMSLMLSLLKNIPQADASLRNKQWEKKKFKGIELYDKILGIIGLGRIGSRVAKLAKAFDMKIIAYDPIITSTYAEEIGVKLVDLNELLQTSDIITIHTLLNETTKHLISEKEFAIMKKGVRIINCARGGIIDEKDLYNAIKQGKVAGVALDVFEKEPPLDSPLLDLQEIIFTPHLGASTGEAQVRNAVEIAKKVVEILKR